MATETTPADKPLRRPTLKWWAAQVTAIGAFVQAVIDSGGVSTELKVIFVGIVVQSIVTYLVPSPDAPSKARARAA